MEIKVMTNVIRFINTSTRVSFISCCVVMVGLISSNSVWLVEEGICLWYDSNGFLTKLEWDVRFSAKDEGAFPSRTGPKSNCEERGTQCEQIPLKHQFPFFLFGNELKFSRKGGLPFLVRGGSVRSQDRFVQVTLPRKREELGRLLNPQELYGGSLFGLRIRLKSFGNYLVGCVIKGGKRLLEPGSGIKEEKGL
uniref:Uncharacterized protein n=1 Tax=Solanum lycopersicum TaxID=4081 RepID=A0A3Q7J9D6_SOLLC